jgi:hypothetical protein
MRIGSENRRSTSNEVPDTLSHSKGVLFSTARFQPFVIVLYFRSYAIVSDSAEC